jgi:hypothetical protein
MSHNYDLWRRDLHRKNVQMAVLCALCSLALLVSPLAPYRFDLRTVAGVLGLTLGCVAIAVPLGWIGISLNHLAAYHYRITRHTVRSALRRGWRR